MMPLDRLNAQFSPGELARAHHSLEGTQKCAQCHDIGKEISGEKCLTCHLTIGRALDMKRGYHFAVSEKKCISCHKEHLGLNAQITLVKPANIDHARTGFALKGKHGKVKCESCHDPKNIKDPEVLHSISVTPRMTYLGLDQTCVSCHDDRHRGKLGTNCTSCHTADAWSTIPTFDHSKTKFTLTGEHKSVQCVKCHPTISPSSKDAPVDLSTKTFSDCTPCHATPHSEKFSSQTCVSCHTTEGWKVKGAEPFDHNRTSFRLLGRHAQVKCQQCHKDQGKNARGASLKMAHDKCTDCHPDKHNAQFVKRYNNDCARCHTEQGFAPSTFTLTQHDAAFRLTGAHMATLCNDCHTVGADSVRIFRFAEVTCTSCHKDPHKGAFKAVMANNGCTSCHTTTSWKEAKFDHGTTRFALQGKHEKATCDQCHKQTVSGKVKIVYKGLAMECQSCHADVHGNQFGMTGKVDCARCHRPDGWKTLVFDHEAGCDFKLTGAHKNVPCKSCHRPEPVGKKTIVRYKPISTACESCHKGMKQ